MIVSVLPWRGGVETTARTRSPAAMRSKMFTSGSRCRGVPNRGVTRGMNSPSGRSANCDDLCACVVSGSADAILLSSLFSLSSHSSIEHLPRHSDLGKNLDRAGHRVDHV